MKTLKLNYRTIAFVVMLIFSLLIVPAVGQVNDGLQNRQQQPIAGDDWQTFQKEIMEGLNSMRNEAEKIVAEAKEHNLVSAAFADAAGKFESESKLFRAKLDEMESVPPVKRDEFKAEIKDRYQQLNDTLKKLMEEWQIIKGRQ